MIYLDNAATSHPKPAGVAVAVGEAVSQASGNPGRAGHAASRAAGAVVASARTRAAALLGVETDRLCFASSGTDAIAVALYGLLFGSESASAGMPRVVTTQAEHNAVRRPLAAWAAAGRITLVEVGCNGWGWVDPQAVAEAVNAETTLLVVTHASNVTGAVQDVGAMREVSRASGARSGRGTWLMVDAAQTAGLIEIDVSGMGIDAVVSPGHKGMLGPAGTGVVGFGAGCGSGRTFGVCRPGGGAGDSVVEAQPGDLPDRLEAGTLNVPGLAGLDAALRDRPGEASAVLGHELALLDGLVDATLGLPGLTWYAAPRDRARVATAVLTLEGYEPGDLAAVLDASFGIAVRSGMHCAPGVHRCLGRWLGGARCG